MLLFARAIESQYDFVGDIFDDGDHGSFQSQNDGGANLFPVQRRGRRRPGAGAAATGVTTGAAIAMCGVSASRRFPAEPRRHRLNQQRLKAFDPSMDASKGFLDETTSG